MLTSGKPFAVEDAAQVRGYAVERQGNDRAFDVIGPRFGGEPFDFAARGVVLARPNAVPGASSLGFSKKGGADGTDSERGAAFSR